MILIPPSSILRTFPAGASSARGPGRTVQTVAHRSASYRRDRGISHSCRSCWGPGQPSWFLISSCRRPQSPGANSPVHQEMPEGYTGTEIRPLPRRSLKRSVPPETQLIVYCVPEDNRTRAQDTEAGTLSVRTGHPSGPHSHLRRAPRHSRAGPGKPGARFVLEPCVRSLCSYKKTKNRTLETHNIRRDKSGLHCRTGLFVKGSFVRHHGAPVLRHVPAHPLTPPNL